MGSTKPRLVLGTLLLALLSGCIWVAFPDPEPPPEAVLEGTWQIITENESDITELFWLFDANGDLIEIRYKISTPLGETTVTESNPTQETTVDADHVTIQVGFSNNNFLFEGTFNAAIDRADGQISINYNWFDTTISVDRGPASLVKQ